MDSTVSSIEVMDSGSLAVVKGTIASGSVSIYAGNSYEKLANVVNFTQVK